MHPDHWDLPISHSALSTERSHCSSVLPLNYPTIPQCSIHWALPLFHSALVTETSQYPTVLYLLNYPTIPWCSTTELTHYPMRPGHWDIPQSHMSSRLREPRVSRGHLAMQATRWGLCQKYHNTWPWAPTLCKSDQAWFSGDSHYNGGYVIRCQWGDTVKYTPGSKRNNQWSRGRTHIMLPTMWEEVVAKWVAHSSLDHINSVWFHVCASLCALSVVEFRSQRQLKEAQP